MDYRVLLQITILLISCFGGLLKEKGCQPFPTNFASLNRKIKKLYLRGFRNCWWERLSSPWRWGVNRAAWGECKIDFRLFDIFTCIEQSQQNFHLGIKVRTFFSMTNIVWEYVQNCFSWCQGSQEITKKLSGQSFLGNPVHIIKWKDSYLVFSRTGDPQENWCNGERRTRLFWLITAFFKREAAKTTMSSS